MELVTTYNFDAIHEVQLDYDEYLPDLAVLLDKCPALRQSRVFVYKF